MAVRGEYGVRLVPWLVVVVPVLMPGAAATIEEETGYRFVTVEDGRLDTVYTYTDPDATMIREAADTDHDGDVTSDERRALESSTSNARNRSLVERGARLDGKAALTANVTTVAIAGAIGSTSSTEVLKIFIVVSINWTSTDENRTVHELNVPDRTLGVTGSNIRRVVAPPHFTIVSVKGLDSWTCPEDGSSVEGTRGGGDAWGVEFASSGTCPADDEAAPAPAMGFAAVALTMLVLTVGRRRRGRT